MSIKTVRTEDISPDCQACGERGNCYSLADAPPTRAALESRLAQVEKLAEAVLELGKSALLLGSEVYRAKWLEIVDLARKYKGVE